MLKFQTQTFRLLRNFYDRRTYTKTTYSKNSNMHKILPQTWNQNKLQQIYTHTPALHSRTDNSRTHCAWRHTTLTVLQAGTHCGVSNQPATPVGKMPMHTDTDVMSSNCVSASQDTAMTRSVRPMQHCASVFLPHYSNLRICQSRGTVPVQHPPTASLLHQIITRSMRPMQHCANSSLPYYSKSRIYKSRGTVPVQHLLSCNATKLRLY